MKRASLMWVASLLLAAGCAVGSNPEPGGTDSGMLADGGLPVQGLTWYKDVLPIVEAHCQECHVAGGIAPFPLLTYSDGQAHASLMAAAVQALLMPPWKPAAGCNSYQNDRSLSADQINTLVSWAATGATEGDASDAPPPPDAGMAGLDRVDATLDAGVDYTPSNAFGNDDYHCLVLDPHLTQATDVIGVNILPGVPSEVHHVVLYSTTAAEAQAAQMGQPGPGYTCFGGSGTGTSMMVGAWAPGSPATMYPSGTGISLPAGNVIVMQVHYNLSNGAAMPDRTQVQFEYSTAPVAKQAKIGGPSDHAFSIPPNAMGYASASTVTVPTDVQFWGVIPHMHLLGATIEVTVNNTCLVNIPKWDFHWQQMYFFDQPIQVSAGSQVTVSCTWNNTTDQTVSFGEGTADEMCLGFLYTTPP